MKNQLKVSSILYTGELTSDIVTINKRKAHKSENTSKNHTARDISAPFFSSRKKEKKTKTKKTHKLPNIKTPVNATFSPTLNLNPQTIQSGNPKVNASNATLIICVHHRYRGIVPPICQP